MSHVQAIHDAPWPGSAHGWATRRTHYTVNPRGTPAATRARRARDCPESAPDPSPRRTLTRAEHLLTRRVLLARALTVGSAALSECVYGSVAAAHAGRRDVAPVAAATPRTGGTLRIAKVGDVVSAGAPFLLTPSNLHLFPLVYDTLVTYDAHLTPQPRLASSWQWSSDARRLTLTLRPGRAVPQWASVHQRGRQSSTSNTCAILRSVRPGAATLNLMHISTPDPLTLVIDYDAPVQRQFRRARGHAHGRSAVARRHERRPRLLRHRPVSIPGVGSRRPPDASRATLTTGSPASPISIRSSSTSCMIPRRRWSRSRRAAWTGSAACPAWTHADCRVTRPTRSC